MEEWKSIMEIEGTYSVSNFGNIRRDKPAKGAVVGKIIKQKISNKGYSMINLCMNGKHRCFNVHSLVATAFIGYRPEKLQVNHKNCIKTDNHINNLEYATASENLCHAHKNGLMNLRFGSNHPKSKLTEEQVINIREEYASKPTLKSISEKYKIHKNTLLAILKRKTWKHV